MTEAYDADYWSNFDGSSDGPNDGTSEDDGEDEDIRFRMDEDGEAEDEDPASNPENWETGYENEKPATP